MENIGNDNTTSITKTDNNTEKKHNGIISFWKFMFSIMILFYHFSQDTGYRYFKQGYLGVEFFFLISGYLMAKKALSIKEYKKEEIGILTLKYIWKKIKSLFPYILINYTISIFVKSSFRSFKTYQYVRSIWNLFLIDMSGITTTYMIGQTWYISAMLISMLILYPLILKYKKNFIYLVSPLIVIFIGGFISQNYINLNYAYKWNGIIMVGLLRAFFEIAIGTLIYVIVEQLRKYDFTTIGKIVLTVIEIICFIVTWIIMCKSLKHYDFFVLMLMSIAITIAFSENNIMFKRYCNSFFYYLEKLSLMIYLDHIWIKDIVIHYLSQGNNIIQLLIILLLTIIISIILEYFIKKLKKMIKNIYKKMENIFIRKKCAEI